MPLAWLTPDIEELSESQEQRVICCPGSLWYLVGGALESLTESWNWEEFGTATAEEMASFFQDVRDEFDMSNGAYIGEVRAFMVETLPERWLPFDGQQRDEADYPELFAVLPSTLIPPVPGNTFLLPSLAARSLVGAGSIAGANVPLGTRIGQSQITLNISQIPAHDHTYTPPVANVDLEAPGAPDILAAGLGAPTQTSAEGGGQPHSNMPPVIGVTWGIYAGR